MRVAAAVAAHAMGEVADTFLHVLAADIGHRVFMAAVAGVGAVVVADMAGGAGRVVVFVQHKVLGVVKSSRCPLGAGVALRTVAADLPMQRVSGRGVAALALAGGSGVQQAVVKAALQVVTAHTRVVAVAADAILAGQRLVERCAAERLGNRGAQGGQLADVGWLVAADALGRAGAGESAVAGEAVGVDGLVAWMSPTGV